MNKRDFNLNMARIERDAAMERVNDGDNIFAPVAKYLILCWLLRRRATGNVPFIAEDVWRDILTDCPKPRHPNQRGATWNAFVQAELVLATGELGQMKSVGSHARKTPIYRVCPAVSQVMAA